MISEATRQKVLRAASELNYLPNETARNLAMSRHPSIGLFICHSHSVFADAYIFGLIEGMSKILNKYRFQLVLQPLKTSNSDYLALARQDGVEGIILLNPHEDDVGLSRIIQAGFPLAIIGTLADKEILQVDIDNFSAARIVADYLIGLGHRRIGMITHASPIYWAARKRLEGYRAALERAGLPADDEHILFADFSEESGLLAMKKLLAASERPTAVFAGNDVIAYGAIQAVRDANLNVPRDISIAGFDDDFLSRYLNPPLTTMSLPAASLGAEVSKLLIHGINGKTLAHKQIIISPHLAVRGSCAPPRGDA